MHGKLFPTKAPVRHQSTVPSQQPYWLMLGLMFGGVITVAWSGFLLWLAFKLGTWALS